MVAQESLIVILVRLVDGMPLPTRPSQRRRGHPRVYRVGPFLKALVIMLIRRVHTPSGLSAILAQPTTEMQALRQLPSTEHSRHPSRRSWERRLASIPATLPGQFGCLGRLLVTLLQPWSMCGRAAAIDGSALRACRGVSHRNDREAALVPHTSIVTEAAWTKSGWHGWVYGWQLHLVCTAAAVWIPLAAELTRPTPPTTSARQPSSVNCQRNCDFHWTRAE